MASTVRNQGQVNCVFSAFDLVQQHSPCDAIAHICDELVDFIKPIQKISQAYSEVCIYSDIRFYTTEHDI